MPHKKKDRNEKKKNRSAEDDRLLEISKKKFYKNEDMKEIKNNIMSDTKFLNKNLVKKVKEKYEDEEGNEFTSDCSESEMIEDTLDEADNIVEELKIECKTDKNFAHKSDNDKIEWIQIKHKHFQQTYPIVCRYMLCEGRYDRKAFKKYLSRVYRKTQTSSNEKGDKEDIWCINQAYYVKYLYEESWKKKGKKVEEQYSKFIFEDSYKKMKKEFKDFRNKYEKAEKKINEEKKVIKHELVEEMLEIIKDEEKFNMLDEDQKKYIINFTNNRIITHHMMNNYNKRISFYMNFTKYCDDNKKVYADNHMKNFDLLDKITDLYKYSHTPNPNPNSETKYTDKWINKHNEWKDFNKDKDSLYKLIEKKKISYGLVEPLLVSRGKSTYGMTKKELKKFKNKQRYRKTRKEKEKLIY